jgi:NAD(P)-dependent dehydrogenase (short-subunit alcohol dehydrogenase family)
MELIRQAGGDAAFAHCDVSNWADVRSMVEVALREWGRIDVLYNNAAATRLCNEKDRAAHELDEHVWDRQIDITLKGVYLCSKACVPTMLEHGRGVILNVSSCDAILPEGGFDSYTAAKGGVISLTKSMAVNYGKKGIRINCISPGYEGGGRLSPDAAAWPAGRRGQHGGVPRQRPGGIHHGGHHSG